MDVVSSLRAQRGEVVEAGHAVQLRPQTAADDRLLRDLQTEPRGSVLLMPMDVREMLCDIKFREDRRRLAAEHPMAECEIVVLDGVDVGRIVLERSPGAIRVVDLAIHRDRRRRGIAGAVLRQVIADAGESRVVLCVRSDEQAVLALCRQLDFTRTAEADGYITLDHVRAESGIRVRTAR